MSQVFFTLAILACPVGMGAMMWFMMRGSGKNATAGDAASIGSEAELSKLRAEVEDLRANQARFVGTAVSDPR